MSFRHLERRRNRIQSNRIRNTTMRRRQPQSRRNPAAEPLDIQPRWDSQHLNITPNVEINRV